MNSNEYHLTVNQPNEKISGSTFQCIANKSIIVILFGTANITLNPYIRAHFYYFCMIFKERAYFCIRKYFYT